MLTRFWFLCLLLLSGCTVLPPAELPPTELSPTHTVTPTATTRDTWQTPHPGLETLATSDGLTALRHAATALRYDHRFEPAPDLRRPLSNWLASEQAIAAVNCGFFWDDGGLFRHLGLLMSNGHQDTALRSGWGGVLIVRDGAAMIVGQPQRLLAPATLAVQGWPMLVENGRSLSRLNEENVHRRTAVGVDGQGRLLWVAAPLGMTLTAFAERLTQPDLDLIHAVNLDGGSSTGLRWRTSSGQSGPDSLPIPCAILFYLPEPVT